MRADDRLPFLYMVPPPLTRPVDKPSISGIEIPSEFAPGEGVLFWKSFRNVALWSAGPSCELFCAGSSRARTEAIRSSAVDDELKSALAVIARLLDNRLADVAGLAYACEQVSVWAERNGKLATALAFLQLVASLQPGCGRAAYRVARLARIRGEYDRAETWFEHAVVLSRAEKDWQSYAEVYAGLGTLYFLKGSFAKARRHHLRCLRTARRHRLAGMQGAALHNLCRIAIETDDERQAEDYAAQALRAYPRGDCGLKRLALDVAYYWMLRGDYHPALTVLQELVSHLEAQSDRAAILAGIARSAAGMGDVETFDRAWAQAWVNLSEQSGVENEAAILLDLAHGAVSLEEWRRAERTAERACEAARARNEEKALFEAAILLEFIGKKERNEGEARITASSRRLADDMAETLRSARTGSAASFPTGCPARAPSPPAFLSGRNPSWDSARGGSLQARGRPDPHRR